MNKIEFEIKSIEKVLRNSWIKKEGSLVDQIYKTLRANIINLSLPPEMPLVEKEIASIVEISKTPVREALIRLENDRLVSIVPKSGSYVTPISLERYIEACFIRVSLEGGCVKRLAERGIGLAEKIQIQSIIRKQEQLSEQDSDAFELKADSPHFEANEEFHRTLFGYADFSGAWLLLNSAKAEIDRVRHLKNMMGINRQRSIIDEHTDIVQAILDRDPQKAEHAMIRHIGDINEETEIISNNPLFISTMQDFNSLISEQRRRRNASTANGRRFVSKRVIF
ncbi:GntR family transcriptional regulator [Gilvimarinus agarilyticus]|uniref:GntR family transcriptional regulator n=1 Tax=unclassified Gilvimarinus TaxID=2642066 RepID=UPI001C08156B|nr:MULTISPECIES: GntR family transcriptional regulator [unclassified Gilvimarinus]MBU2886223.1 GntR family transcriptional regulator [Gilvimarinus agarilyticus]MDO6570911.1 GntR family transcriptional regulator [Gilvimarinus sp. 2_MG-2023]MDO6747802.1 GntR family transcriptional regulator [Gilvimarinus sp. 1_MG-2023]